MKEPVIQTGQGDTKKRYLPDESRPGSLRVECGDPAEPGRDVIGRLCPQCAVRLRVEFEIVAPIGADDPHGYLAAQVGTLINWLKSNGYLADRDGIAAVTTTSKE